MIRYAQPTYNNATNEMIAKALDSRNTAGGGALTIQLEKEAAEFVGSRYAVAVCNASMGLLISVKAMLNLGHFEKDSELVVPDITYPATANAGILNGLTVEIMQPDDKSRMVLNLNPIYQSIGVSFAGYQDFNGSKYIMDDAHMMREFFWQDKPLKPLCSVVSLHAIKQWGAGEGGMIFTDNEEVYQELLRLVRNKMTSVEPVYNARMSDIQCAVAISMLPNLEEHRIHKLALAKVYEELFSPYIELATPMFAYERDKYSHALHLYVVTFESNAMRNSVAKALEQNEIETRVHFPPLTQVYKVSPQDAYQTRNPVRPKILTNQSNRTSAEHYARALSLPIHADLSTDDVERIVRIICQTVES